MTAHREGFVSAILDHQCWKLQRPLLTHRQAGISHLCSPSQRMETDMCRKDACLSDADESSGALDHTLCARTVLRRAHNVKWIAAA